jgi:hypothetical protein
VSAELLFALSIAVKMIVTAVFFVSATLVAERAGPLVGGLVSTLPVSSGPAYAMLALDHDTVFISEAALGSVVVTADICVFVLVYVALAQRHRQVVCVAAALAAWVVVAAVLRLFVWTTISAIGLNIAVFVVCLAIGHRYRRAPRRVALRRWYDVPLRAGMAATVVAVVVAISETVNTTLTGMVAAFPVVMFSLMLILHPRLGGPGAAALLANSMIGLIGFGLFCLMLHLSVVPLGFVAGLLIAVGANAGFNLATWAVHRHIVKA